MPDAAIELEPLDGLSIDAQIAAITHLPGFAGWAHVANFAVTPTATSEDYQIFFAPLDDGLGVEVMTPRYIEGHAPEAAGEISMDENRAELIGLELGDTVPAISFTPADVEALFTERRPHGSSAGWSHVVLRLVGIERTPASIASDLDIASITTASRAFTQQYGDESACWASCCSSTSNPATASTRSSPARCRTSSAPRRRSRAAERAPEVSLRRSASRRGRWRSSPRSWRSPDSWRSSP